LRIFDEWLSQGTSWEKEFFNNLLWLSFYGLKFVINKLNLFFEQVKNRRCPEYIGVFEAELWNEFIEDPEYKPYLEELLKQALLNQKIVENRLSEIFKLLVKEHAGSEERLMTIYKTDLDCQESLLGKYGEVLEILQRNPKAIGEKLNHLVPQFVSDTKIVQALLMDDFGQLNNVKIDEYLEDREKNVITDFEKYIC